MNSIVTLGTFCLTHPFYLRPSDGGKEECLGGRTGHRSWMTGLPDPSPHCPDDPGPQLYHWPPKISYSTSAPLTKPWHRFANAEGTHAKEWRKRLAGPIPVTEVPSGTDPREMVLAWSWLGFSSMRRWRSFDMITECICNRNSIIMV